MRGTRFRPNLYRFYVLIITSFLLLTTPHVPPAAGQEKEIHLSLSRPLTVKWTYQTDATINLTPMTDGVNIYLPLAFGVITSLNAADGKLIWKTDLGGEISSSPTADQDGVYIASKAAEEQGSTKQATGVIRALGREGGITLWVRTLPTPLRGSLALSGAILYGG